jgi:hypothetical protein
MSIQQFFPFVPQHMDWEAWNGNLIIFYSEESVPFHPEAEWQMTAKSVAQLPTFSAYPVPDPDLYPDWQTWADEFTLIINGPSK